MTYVDLHLHGAFGIDVLTAAEAELDRLARALSERGYAAFLPTLVPVAFDALEATLSRLAPWIAGRREGDGRGALPLGVHFEGPFVQPTRAGALHREALLDAADARAVDRFLRLADACPGRTMITLAPEIPGGLDLVRACAGRGWLVAAGHTAATRDQLEAAVVAGARHLTHFCNAMRPFHHREPGPIGFGLVCDELSLDLIADLHHVHPDVLALALRTKPPAKLALISDAAPAAGLTDGEYTTWGETITVRGGEARNAAGDLAGAVALLDEAVENLVACGAADRERAAAAASSVPRAILGA
ncbi:MAG: N-acetylglucosamine-6-phosphate deacetylase [Planctomycetota bacterium JB042]